MSYVQADVFLICFSIDSIDSLQNVKNKWKPELDHHCRGAPIVLVGCKLDLRGPAGVSVDSALAMKEEIGTVKYVECSALTQKGLKNVFDSACRAAMPPPKRTCFDQKCVIM
jgi:small GTP-binding protein